MCWYMSTIECFTPGVASPSGQYYRVFNCQAPNMVTPSNDLGRGMATLIETSSAAPVAIPTTVPVTIDPFVCPLMLALGCV
jgi:hypothetical protein